MSLSPSLPARWPEQLSAPLLPLPSWPLPVPRRDSSAAGAAGPVRQPSVRSVIGWLQWGVIFLLLRPLPSPFSSACTFTAFEAFIFPEQMGKKVHIGAF